MNYDSVEQAKDYLLDRIGGVPDVAVILGSGLSAADEILRDAKRIDYLAIPHFPLPKIAGHRGQAVFGKAGRLSVIFFEGRVHHYEGHSMDSVAFCTRVIGRSGTKTVVLTNAAGAINPELECGQLMLITDHINLMGVNPLSGPNEDRWGPRFVDLTDMYEPELRQTMRVAAQRCDLQLAEGVYVAVGGPTYETPAEIRYLLATGGDAVGMSTVPEAVVARHMGLRVTGLSLLTNAAARIAGKAIDHNDVLTMASRMKGNVSRLLLRFFEAYAE